MSAVKKIMKDHEMNITLPANPTLLVGRLMLAFIFILSGWNKIGGFACTQKFMESQGVPGMLLPLVIAAELGLGLLIAVGYKTRLAAIGLAGFTLIAGYLFHFKPAEPMQMVSFMKNIAITGGFLALAFSGAGGWSLDGRSKD
jgi:putative oxidoreductase